ncbi:MAG TPA: lamin tail domain-containing protein [Pyrinomonadaceae bacterium]|nr:lamin tail domain-containing protein [Pyrinomonadaceae bacterium]
MRSISAFALSFISRRRSVCCLLLLALSVAVFAQSSGLPNTEVVQADLCPDIDMCIVDPEGGCMSVPCPSSSPLPVATPRPIPTPDSLCIFSICTTDPTTGRQTCRPAPCPFAQPHLATAPAAIMISEFRFRGPNGVNDEFVEIFNNTPYTVKVDTIDGSGGWALVASDGRVRFIIPVGTLIPSYGHFLAVNALGYSLGSYPAGNGTTAAADASYALDIPDGSGIALFATADPLNFTPNYRFDAAGYEITPSLYREGAGFPFYGAETFIPLQYSFYRDLTTGRPKDTDDNKADFMGVDTNYYNTSAGQHLGAPGPENLSSPVNVGGRIQLSMLDPAVSSTAEPNRVRTTVYDPENNSTYGTMSFRRTITNISSTNITRLRFRIVNITTFPAATGDADLRPRSSYVPFNVMISDGSIKTVMGTSLETPPGQPNGGGFNSSMSADDVTLAQPLAPGQSISLQFLLGVQQSGTFRFNIIVETL